MIADQVYSCGPRPLGGQLMHRLMHFGPLLAPWPALGPTPGTATRAGGGVRGFRRGDLGSSGWATRNFGQMAL